MIDIPRLLIAAAELFNVAPEQIAAGGRGHERLISCRQALAIVLAAQQYTTTEIGQIIGRDHSTISNTLKQARRKLEDDPTFAARVRSLAATLQSAPPDRTVAETVARRRIPWIIAPEVQISAFWWGVPDVVSA